MTLSKHDKSCDNGHLICAKSGSLFSETIPDFITYFRQPERRTRVDCRAVDGGSSKLHWRVVTYIPSQHGLRETSRPVETFHATPLRQAFWLALAVSCQSPPPLAWQRCKYCKYFQVSQFPTINPLNLHHQPLVALLDTMPVFFFSNLPLGLPISPFLWL